MMTKHDRYTLAGTLYILTLVVLFLVALLHSCCEVHSCEKSSINMTVSRLSGVTMIPTIIYRDGRKEAVFDVREFGAKQGDGIQDDSAAVRAALAALQIFQTQSDLANGSNKAGLSTIYPTLYFPRHYTFTSAPFNLTSHMILRVDGTLQAISNTTEGNFEDSWPKILPSSSYGNSDDAGFHLQYHPFIFARDATNMKIVGEGVIDGVGQWWWDAFHRLPGSTVLYAGRPNLIQLQNCSRVDLYQVELRNSAFWTLHPLYCRDMSIQKIRIRAPMYSPNVDGIDLDSCQNVLVEECDISCGDDHIVIKAGVCSNGGTHNRNPIECSKDIRFRNGFFVSRNLTIRSNVWVLVWVLH